MQFTFRPADTYVPLYFLSSVGSGGLTVTFFMYLMFWIPHTGRPVPVFENILTAFNRLLRHASRYHRSAGWYRVLHIS